MNVGRKRLRRLSIIYRELERHDVISTRQMLKKVNSIVDEPVCKSTIEKDLFSLRMDFDVETKVAPGGLRLVEKTNFVDALLEYLNIVT